MSSNKSRKQQQPVPSPKNIKASPQEAGSAAPFSIPYPLLWLSVAVLAAYFATLYFGFTDYDDGIFINDQHAFNENLHNIIVAFQKNVFIHNDKDIYYRPLFLVSMILNNQLCGQNIGGYHVVNVLLHLGAVLLLYRLFIKLEVKKLHSFILSLVFAVHPVLAMAVAWIPGRNDVLLAIFAFAFFIKAIDYSNNGNKGALAASGFFLCCCFFTKESAFFLPPAAFVLLSVALRKSWRAKRSIIQYALWICCFLFWVIMRMMAHVATGKVSAQGIAHGFFARLPVLVQYMGKIFFPFNLSVFPNIQDTVYYYGVAAIILLCVLVWLSKKKDLLMVGAGLAIFLLLLMPVLLIPDYVNQQTFEHRLYLPMLGILLVIPQTALFQNRLTDRQLFFCGLAVCGLLFIINSRYLKSFENPVAFWSQAKESSPHSSYANMMLAARTSDEAESHELFMKAFALNPSELYVNYIYATMLQGKDSILQSEKYLLTEKEVTGYYKCDFLLARVEKEKKDYPKAITYLRSYLKNDPTDTMANLNLLLMYMETDQNDSAVKQAKHMQYLQMTIPDIILKQVHN